MADTTPPEALHADLTERLDWYKAKLERVRQGVNSPSTVAAAEHEVTFYERMVAALDDTVPRAWYDDTHRQARLERDALIRERDSYRRDAEAWRGYMAQQASVDNATPPRYATGGPTGEPPRRPRGDSPSYVLTQADARRLGVPLDAQVPRALRPDKTTALAEDRETDPTDDCD